MGDRSKDDSKTEPCNHEAMLGQKGDSLHYMLGTVQLQKTKLPGTSVSFSEDLGGGRPSQKHLRTSSPPTHS